MARLVFTDKDHNAYDPKKYRVSSITTITIAELIYSISLAGCSQESLASS